MQTKLHHKGILGCNHSSKKCTTGDPWLPYWNSKSIVACFQWMNVKSWQLQQSKILPFMHNMSWSCFFFFCDSASISPMRNTFRRRDDACNTCCLTLILIRGSLFISAVMRFSAMWMGILLQFCHATIYTNDWAIRIRGDSESVNRIAEKYGFTNMGQVSVMPHTAP